MDILSINWLAVLVCVVISMLSGSLWYNPKTFFLIWWKGIGKSEQSPPGTDNMAVTWALTIFSSLVQAVAMAVLVRICAVVIGGPSLTLGVLTGFFTWLGLIAPTYLVNKLFAGHGFKVWAIEAGNHLLNFVLFGAVLAIWQ